MATKAKNNHVIAIVEAALIVVIGVLFCCSKAMGEAALSWVIGVSFMLGGVGLWALGLAEKKALFNAEGLLGSLLFAFGLSFGLAHLASVLFYIAVWLLIIGGSVILLDVILRIALRKDRNTLGIVIEAIIGAVSLTLGLCLYLIPEFGQFAAIILGVMLILYGVFMFVNEVVLSSKRK